MKIVKVKTCTGTEIFINLEHIDYVNPRDGVVYFTDRYITLNDEGMKKVVASLDQDVESEVEKPLVEYEDLQVGDTFKTFKDDKRVFRKEKEGAIQIRDSSGNPCEGERFKTYLYIDHPVYKEEV